MSSQQKLKNTLITEDYNYKKEYFSDNNFQNGENIKKTDRKEYLIEEINKNQKAYNSQFKKQSTKIFSDRMDNKKSQKSQSFSSSQFNMTIKEIKSEKDIKDQHQTKLYNTNKATQVEKSVKPSSFSYPKNYLENSQKTMQSLLIDQKQYSEHIRMKNAYKNSFYTTLTMIDKGTPIDINRNAPQNFFKEKMYLNPINSPKNFNDISNNQNLKTENQNNQTTENTQPLLKKWLDQIPTSLLTEQYQEPFNQSNKPKKIKEIISGRQEVWQVAEWLDNQLKEFEKKKIWNQITQVYTHIQQVFQFAFSELIRQTYAECKERAELMEKMWCSNQQSVIKVFKFLENKIYNAEISILEEQNNLHDSYQKKLQSLGDQIKEMQHLLQKKEQLLNSAIIDYKAEKTLNTRLEKLLLQANIDKSAFKKNYNELIKETILQLLQTHNLSIQQTNYLRKVYEEAAIGKLERDVLFQDLQKEVYELTKQQKSKVQEIQVGLMTTNQSFKQLVDQLDQQDIVESSDEEFQNYYQEPPQKDQCQDTVELQLQNTQEKYSQIYFNQEFTVQTGTDMGISYDHKSLQAKPETSTRTTQTDQSGEKKFVSQYCQHDQQLLIYYQQYKDQAVQVNIMVESLNPDLKNSVSLINLKNTISIKEINENLFDSDLYSDSSIEQQQALQTPKSIEKQQAQQQPQKASQQFSKSKFNTNNPDVNKASVQNNINTPQSQQLISNQNSKKSKESSILQGFTGRILKTMKIDKLVNKQVPIQQQIQVQQQQQQNKGIELLKRKVNVIKASTIIQKTPKNNKQKVVNFQMETDINMKDAEEDTNEANKNNNDPEADIAQEEKQVDSDTEFQNKLKHYYTEQKQISLEKEQQQLQQIQNEDIEMFTMEKDMIDKNNKKILKIISKLNSPQRGNDTEKIKKLLSRNNKIQNAILSQIKRKINQDYDEKIQKDLELAEKGFTIEDIEQKYKKQNKEIQFYNENLEILNAILTEQQQEDEGETTADDNKNQLLNDAEAQEEEKNRSKKSSLMIINQNQKNGNQPKNMTQQFLIQQQQQQQQNQQTNTIKQQRSTQIHSILTRIKKKQTKMQNMIDIGTLDVLKKSKRKQSTNENVEALYQEMIFEFFKSKKLTNAPQNNQQTEFGKKQIKELKKLIINVYQEILKQMKFGEELSKNLFQYLFDHYYQKYGLKNVAENKLKNVIRLIFTYKDSSSDIKAFAILLGVNSDNSTPNSEQINFFMKCLMALDESQSYKVNNLERIMTSNTKFMELAPKLMQQCMTKSDIFDCIVDVLNLKQFSYILKNEDKVLELIPQPTEKVALDINMALEKLLIYHNKATIALNATYKHIYLSMCQEDQLMTKEKLLILLNNLEINGLIYYQKFVDECRLNSEMEECQKINDDDIDSDCKMDFDQFILFCNKYDLFSIKKQDTFIENTNHKDCLLPNPDLVDDENQMHFLENQWNKEQIQIKKNFLLSNQYKVVYKNMIDNIDRYMQEKKLQLQLAQQQQLKLSQIDLNINQNQPNDKQAEKIIIKKAMFFCYKMLKNEMRKRLCQKYDKIFIPEEILFIQQQYINLILNKNIFSPNKHNKQSPEINFKQEQEINNSINALNHIQQSNVHFLNSTLQEAIEEKGKNMDQNNISIDEQNSPLKY